MPPPVVATAPARAALAGNPSDLYGGAVLAVPLHAFGARVEVADAPHPSIEGDPEGEPLVSASLSRSASGEVLAVRWASDIPRSVGLAGSSAIVIAVLRALATHAGEDLTDLELAQRALAVEVEDLGWVAGLQDRAVQAADAPVLVDLAGAAPVITRLAPARPIRIAVAWDRSAATNSVAYHRQLRQAMPPSAGEGMAGLAALARRAAAAFTGGDAVALADLVGEAGRLRALTAPLPSAHERLAGAVAVAGLAPNSAGSGGAVSVVVTDDDRLRAMTEAVRAVGGDVVVETYGP